MKKKNKTITTSNFSKKIKEIQALVLANKKITIKLFVYMLAVLLSIILVFYFWYKREKNIAVYVNRQKILMRELDNELRITYGKEMLDRLIQEELIKQELVNRGIVISDQQIKKEFDLIYIDPPYNILKKAWDNFESRQKFEQFTKSWLDLVLPKLKNALCRILGRSVSTIT